MICKESDYIIDTAAFLLALRVNLEQYHSGRKQHRRRTAGGGYRGGTAALLVPEVMIMEGERLFWDDVSLEEFRQRLGCRMIMFDATPQGCYQTLQRCHRHRGPGADSRTRPQ